MIQRYPEEEAEFMRGLCKAIVLFGNQMSKSKMDGMLSLQGQLEGCISEASEDWHRDIWRCAFIMTYDMQSVYSVNASLPVGSQIEGVSVTKFQSYCRTRSLNHCCIICPPSQSLRKSVVEAHVLCVWGCSWVYLMYLMYADQDAMTSLDWRFAFGDALEVPNSSPKTARVLCGRRRPSVIAPWRNQEVSCAYGMWVPRLEPPMKENFWMLLLHIKDIWHIHWEVWWNCHAYLW